MGGRGSSSGGGGGGGGGGGSEKRKDEIYQQGAKQLNETRKLDSNLVDGTDRQKDFAENIREDYRTKAKTNLNNSLNDKPSQERMTSDGKVRVVSRDGSGNRIERNLTVKQFQNEQGKEFNQKLTNLQTQNSAIWWINNGR